MIITQNLLREFEHHLYLEEKEPGTIGTYPTAVRQFAHWCGRQTVSKELVLGYKSYLIDRYSPGTVNSKIGPINLFLRYCGCEACCVKRLRIQRQLCYPQERELYYAEYVRLIDAAEPRLALILQTLCATGIRVSELKFITVEAARQLRACVRNKGKSRVILIPGELAARLLRYARERDIDSGAIFRGACGRPLDRVTIWKQMNALCGVTGVSAEKLHPHALRHLFAVTYYQRSHDPMGLADLLGHSSLDTTRLYTATNSAEQRRQVEQLGLVI